jgi:hypothetical protein
MRGGERAGQKRRAEAMNMPTIATTAETTSGAFRLVVTSIVARLPFWMGDPGPGMPAGIPRA